MLALGKGKTDNNDHRGWRTVRRLRGFSVEESSSSVIEENSSGRLNTGAGRSKTRAVPAGCYVKTHAALPRCLVTKP
jgi:hypothetical protein